MITRGAVQLPGLGHLLVIGVTQVVHIEKEARHRTHVEKMNNGKTLDKVEVSPNNRKRNVRCPYPHCIAHGVRS